MINRIMGCLINQWWTTTVSILPLYLFFVVGHHLKLNIKSI